MTEAQEREQIASKKEHEMKDVLNSQSDAIVVVKTNSSPEQIGSESTNEMSSRVKSTAYDSAECLFCNT